MGVSAGFCVYDVVVKVHVRCLICCWVLVWILWTCVTTNHLEWIQKYKPLQRQYLLEYSARHIRDQIQHEEIICEPLFLFSCILSEGQFKVICDHASSQYSWKWYIDNDVVTMEQNTVRKSNAITNDLDWLEDHFSWLRVNLSKSNISGNMR